MTNIEDRAAAVRRLRRDHGGRDEHVVRARGAVIDLATLTNLVAGSLGGILIPQALHTSCITYSLQPKN